MKNFLLFSLFLFAFNTGFLIFVRSQSITSLSVLPSNPIATDTILVLAECTFPSGGCEPYFTGYSQSGNHFYSSVLHCLGSLSVICTWVDSFVITPLPVGTYTFHILLDAGAGPAPCTPGIIPYDEDSASFVVSTATGADPVSLSQQGFSLSPNPSTGIVRITLHDKVQDKDQRYLHIISLTGREFRTELSTHSGEQLLLNLPSGIYFCYVSEGAYRSPPQKLVIVE